jgi:hypothetical protein
VSGSTLAFGPLWLPAEAERGERLTVHGELGVMLLMDGRILGGDAFSTISAPIPRRMAASRARSSTRSKRRERREHRVRRLRTREAFSGTCTAHSGELEGIALAGKRSLRLASSLKLMRRA